MPNQGLPLADRRQVAAGLRAAGWSLRRIAQHLGVSHEAIRDDLRALGVAKPERVTGTDGRRFPTRPRPLTPVDNPTPLTMEDLTAGPDDALTPATPAPEPVAGAGASGPIRPTPAGRPGGGVAQGGGRLARRPAGATPALSADREHPRPGPSRAAPGRSGPPAGSTAPGSSEGQEMPMCADCGRRHPAPGRRDDLLPGLLSIAAPVDPRARGAAPEGWGRQR